MHTILGLKTFFFLFSFTFIFIIIIIVLAIVIVILLFFTVLFVHVMLSFTAFGLASSVVLLVHIWVKLMRVFSLHCKVFATNDAVIDSIFVSFFFVFLVV